MLTAGIVLALMILPYVTAVSRDVLKMVPTVVKEAGYGMGSTTFEVLRHISLRYALSGIVGAVFLGLGRALGETMAVTFLIGGDVNTIPQSLFDPGTTIAATLANTFNEATDPLHVSALMELGLILFLITMVFQLHRADVAQARPPDVGDAVMSRRLDIAAEAPIARLAGWSPAPRGDRAGAGRRTGCAGARSLAAASSTRSSPSAPGPPARSASSSWAGSC